MAVSDNEIVVRDQKVAGSNPVTSTKMSKKAPISVRNRGFFLCFGFIKFCYD